MEAIKDKVGWSYTHWCKKTRATHPSKNFGKLMKVDPKKERYKFSALLKMDFWPTKTQSPVLRLGQLLYPDSGTPWTLGL